MTERHKEENAWACRSVNGGFRLPPPPVNPPYLLAHSFSFASLHVPPRPYINTCRHFVLVSCPGSAVFYASHF